MSIQFLRFFAFMPLVWPVVVTATSDLRPLHGFESNVGQLKDQNGNTNTQVLYICRGNGFNLQLRSTGFSYDIYQLENDNMSQIPDASEKYSGWLNARAEISFHRIDIDFVHPSPALVVDGLNEMQYIHRYRTAGDVEVSSKFYGEILYRNVYDGIDFQFAITQEGQPKFNFIVHPGADYHDIQLDYSGAPMEVCEGKLCLNTSLGVFSESIPLSYAENDASRSNLNFRYITKGNRVSFETDNTLPSASILVIDPLPSVAWSTYCGSNAGDIFYITMTDNSGNIFVVGRTQSLSNIATAGAYQTVFGGNIDGMLAKYDANGVRLWGTYIGGAFSDVAWGMDIDSMGNIYICGYSASSTGIATAGTQQPVKQPGNDAFLMKFTSAGTLTWGTYMGYTGDEVAYSLVIRNDTEIYMCGETSSTSNMATAGTVQPGYGGGAKDAFVCRYTNTGFRSWFSYYGGTLIETLYSLDVHTDGRVVAGGTTTSTNAISTAGAYQTSNNGSSDGFLLCVNSTGTVRNWATYIGGGGTESVTTVDIDVNMYVVFGGNTASSTLVATANGNQTTYGGLQDAFVGMLYLPTAAVEWITYIGGPNVENLFGVVTDAWGYVYAVGSTGSFTSISTTDATQLAYGGGGNDGFMIIYGHVGFKQWGTYFGGADNDAILYIWPITGPGAYICGATTSTAGIATPGAQQTVHGGGGFQDAFLAKLQDLILPVEFSSFEAIYTANNTVLCTWTTASEINNDFFEVQRSNDNLHFETIGVVPSAGNSVVGHTYHFDDDDIATGWWYYRIKQNDFNGAYSYSETKAVFRSATEVIVFPNPTKDWVNVMAQEIISLQIFDLHGRLVFAQQSNAQLYQMSMDLSAMRPGLYHLVIKRSDGTTYHSSIQKH